LIVSANLKTNLTRKQTKEYISALGEYVSQNNITQDVLVFPAVSSLDNHNTTLVVGTQNAYATKNGAYTGEIGLEHLEEFEISTILIGHSERRHILGETQKMVAEKFKFYQDLGFKIVYCVGEPLEIKEAGEDKMMEYISAQYEGIDTDYENLIIAYEPVWAIGTGLTPTIEDIKNTHAKLKQKSKAPLLYGGSVKVGNIKDIIVCDGVDGVLVGSAALDVDDFCTMCQIAQDMEK